MSATVPETSPILPTPTPKVVLFSYPHHDSTLIVGHMTHAEYIAFDSTATVKHELIQGKVVRMPGAKVNHNRIAADAFRTFADAFDATGKQGEVFPDGQKVFVSERLVFYPDMMVIVGETRADASESLLNPAVVLEVLSPSTAAFDRGEKFEYYQQIASLQHYILVEQERISVTHFEKIAGNLWAITGTYNALSDSLTLTIDDAPLLIPLSAIYRRVTFPDVRE